MNTRHHKPADTGLSSPATAFPAVIPTAIPFAQPTAPQLNHSWLTLRRRCECGCSNKVNKQGIANVGYLIGENPQGHWVCIDIWNEADYCNLREVAEALGIGADQ